MALEFVLFLQAVFFFIALFIDKCICNTLINDCCLMIKNETAKKTYYHGRRNVDYLSPLPFLNPFVDARFNIITKCNRKRC